ncbi:hypothetical protein [Desulforhabdus amnigena]|uniref:Uncharacterized protein n=1 Tax=Desulforhabdus amnigena TaxID=40218 RepID=A0A9W6D4G8_9BACT|nr:hypothetical protein [Desulforhabdus amnigena]NLJ29330.1 hypothetical protein [Deltaproteobacteria bacterium]GLI34403.1 hypothetical protein DAMNIGENAA_18360 [Desulforhabdus amnigena]
MQRSFPVHLLVSTPSGPIPLTPERARISLPQGPEAQGALIHYGPFLQAVARFLSQDSYAPLLHSLSRQLDRPIAREDIENVELISEKHGVLYHVVHLRVHIKSERVSLVLNVAVKPEQQAFLESECSLLEMLHQHFGLPYLPRPLFKGEALYTGDDGSELTLKIFMAEWFEGFHEFHLSMEPQQEQPVIKVWGLEEGDTVLRTDQALALYQHASAILTAYLDPASFRQIYPWHHAAGDFILKQTPNGIQLRLVTARDYRALISLGADPEEKWVALVHFFFNLTLRMRMDRLDGTGKRAWAPPESLSGVLSGFLESWSEKARLDPSLPPAEDVLHLLRRFTPREWISLGEVVLEDGMVETDELDFLSYHMAEHVSALMDALDKQRP